MFYARRREDQCESMKMRKAHEKMIIITLTMTMMKGILLLICHARQNELIFPRNGMPDRLESCMQSVTVQPNHPLLTPFSRRYSYSSCSALCYVRFPFVIVFFQYYYVFHNILSLSLSLCFTQYEPNPANQTSLVFYPRSFLNEYIILYPCPAAAAMRRLCRRRL